MHQSAMRRWWKGVWGVWGGGGWTGDPLDGVRVDCGLAPGYGRLAAGHLGDDPVAVIRCPQSKSTSKSILNINFHVYFQCQLSSQFSSQL